MKTALVTGAAGLIGRHLVPKLEELGYEVVALEKVPGVERTALFCLPSEATDTAPYDVVYHLAANIVNIDDRMKGSFSTYSDIELDLAMFKYVSAHPPKQAFIYPSSCAVDSDEDPYGFVKQVGERMCKALHHDGVPVVILRPFSGYGADQSQEYPFPAILKRVIEKQNPVEVWGDGSQVRDWLHISDLVSAFIHAIEKFPLGVPIDIGTGVGCTLNCIAGTMFDKAFPDSPPYEWPAIDNLTGKPMSSRKRVANVGLASDYGWHSKISLEEGVRMEVEAWRKIHP